MNYIEERPRWPTQAPTKEERSERQKGEGDQIKCNDLRLEIWQVVGFRRARRRQDVPWYDVVSTNFKRLWLLL